MPLETPPTHTAQTATVTVSAALLAAARKVAAAAPPAPTTPHEQALADLRAAIAAHDAKP